MKSQANVTLQKRMSTSNLRTNKANITLQKRRL